MPKTPKMLCKNENIGYFSSNFTKYSFNSKISEGTQGELEDLFRNLFA